MLKSFNLIGCNHKKIDRDIQFPIISQQRNPKKKTFQVHRSSVCYAGFMRLSHMEIFYYAN